MALDYLPDPDDIEPRYVTPQLPPPKEYTESRIGKYARMAGKAAAIIGALVGIGRFLWGDGILIERPPRQEQQLEEIVDDSLGLLQTCDEQDPD